MSDSTEPTRCSRCGTEFSGQASPLGLCPACLLALGMSSLQESGIGNQEAGGIREEDSVPRESGIGNQDAGGIRKEESVEQARERAHARRHRWLAVPAV